MKTATKEVQDILDSIDYIALPKVRLFVAIGCLIEIAIAAHPVGNGLRIFMLSNALVLAAFVVYATIKLRFVRARVNARKSMENT
jgi:hypothetical protein